MMKKKIRPNKKGAVQKAPAKRTPFRAPQPKRTRVVTPKVAPEEKVVPTVSQEVNAAGEKLQKVLADAGLGSRREMEALIATGSVTVNGDVAKVGDRVRLNDMIRVRGRLVKRAAVVNDVPKVLLYHKPAGEIVSADDPQGRPSVFDRLPKLNGERWIAVGRLDFNTEGVLLFTTSGALANMLMHPRYRIEREYAVRVQGELSEENKDKLLKGIKLDDGPASFSRIEDIGGVSSNHWYRVTLAEGRNREVRRIFDAVGLTVSRLIRVRFGAVLLPKDLPRGAKMRLSDEWVKGWIEDLKAGSTRAGVVPGSTKDGAGKTRARSKAQAGVGANKGGRKFAAKKDVYDKGYEGVAESKKRHAKRVINVNKTNRAVKRSSR